MDRDMKNIPCFVLPLASNCDLDLGTAVLDLVSDTSSHKSKRFCQVRFETLFSY